MTTKNSPRSSRKRDTLGPVAVLLALAGFVLVAVAGAQPEERPTIPEPSFELEMNVADGFTLAAVGDLILAYPTAQRGDAPFRAVNEIVRKADVAFGNFEISALDMRRLEPPAGRFAGGREVARDIKALGFDIVARANNHLLDFGVAGMLATNEALEEVGLVYAGSGPSYGAARAPRYFETAKGRVGLVAMASSFGDSGRARPARGEIPSRPGLSALRTRRFFVVPADLMNAARALRLAYPSGRSLYPPLGEKAEEIQVLGEWFRLGETTQPYFSYEMNVDDLGEILRSIRIGKQNSDFLMASIHSHETASPIDIHMDPEPADFLVDLAHAAIDNGADAFLGSGVHVLRGIEIYQGKPIFYGLGEFFRQMDGVLGPYTGIEPTARRPLRNSPAIKYESVVAVCRFEYGRLSEVRLHPIDLGWEQRFADRGIPRLAAAQVAQRILERLQRLSAQFGTKLQIEAGVGVIRPR